MRHAKGEYIWFVDSDDLVAPQSLVWADEEFKRNPNLKVLRYYNRRVDEKANIAKLLLETYPPALAQAPTAISLIVRRQHLLENNISFNQSMTYGEDTLWVFEVNFLAGDNYVADGGKVNYFYRKRAGSAMQMRNAETKLKHLQSMEEMLNVYEQILSERQNCLTEAQKQHLCKRIDWSVQNVLFDSLRALPYTERKELFDRLAYKQHSLNWGRLSTKYGLNNFLVNLVGLPLKYKPYYHLMGLIFSRRKN